MPMPPPTSPYHSALGSMGGAAGAPPVAMPSPSGAPPPTNIGAMPTGAGVGSPRTAASAAIMALREYKNQFPSAAQMVDGFIESIKQSSSPAAGMKPGTSPDGNAGLDVAALLGAPPAGATPPPPPPGAAPPM